MAAGRKPEDQRIVNYFKIPVEVTSGKIAIWYKFKHWHPGQPASDFNPEDFEEFSAEKYQELDDVPEGTKRSYEERLKSGRILFPWHLVPHVLIEGPINTNGLEVIRA
jgi:hypothetical protein